MSGAFSASGKALFDDILRDFWVSIALVDRFGIAAWESERFRNEEERTVDIEVPTGGFPYWIVTRLWENRRADEWLFEMSLHFEVDPGMGPTIQLSGGGEGRLWVSFGNPPPPPPPEASTSDSS